MRIDILCATDNNFAEQCATMLASLLTNNRMNDVVVHVFEESLSKDVKNDLLAFVETFGQSLKFYHVTSELLEGCEIQVGSAVTMATFYRLIVTSVISDITIERILYLDCDMVVNCNLACLFDMDMREYPVAAVRDICKPQGEQHAYDIAMSYDSRYFNAGMMLIDLKKWRENNYEKRLLEVSARLKSRSFPDQDPLNIVFRGKWLELAPTWNRFHFVRYYDVHFCTKHDMLDYISHPKIIHYANPTCRPWQDVEYVPLRGVYDKYKAMTPWKDAHRIKVEKKFRYKEIARLLLANFIYRSPLILKFPIVICFDTLLFFYHVIRFRSLEGYSNQKNIIRL